MVATLHSSVSPEYRDWHEIKQGSGDRLIEERCIMPNPRVLVPFPGNRWVRPRASLHHTPSTRAIITEGMLRTADERRMKVSGRVTKLRSVLWRRFGSWILIRSRWRFSVTFPHRPVAYFNDYSWAKPFNVRELDRRVWVYAASMTPNYRESDWNTYGTVCPRGNPISYSDQSSQRCIKSDTP